MASQQLCRHGHQRPGGTGPRPGQCEESAVSRVGAAGEHPVWGSHTGGTGHPGSYSGLLLEQDCVCTSDHRTETGPEHPGQCEGRRSPGPMSRSSVACLPLFFAPCSSVCGSGICAFRHCDRAVSLCGWPGWSACGRACMMGPLDPRPALDRMVSHGPRGPGGEGNSCHACPRCARLPPTPCPCFL